MTDQVKTNILSLFPVLDSMLTELLSTLTPEEWQAQTVAKRWKVKDVAAHLLDGNLRGLSISRDRFFGEKAENIHSYQDLVAFLNNLNLSWTNAARRLSPQVLIELLTITGKQYSEHLQTLNPFDNAIFSVAWAGQETSPNWFHIAREYTEKFLHQQQIRDAVNKPGIMTKELYYPFLDTLMYALPYTFKNIEAPDGTTVSLIVTTGIGGQWNIIKQTDTWELNREAIATPDAQVTIDPVTAWKLFSKSWSPELVMDKVSIEGNSSLAQQALNMIAVMA
ncbi:maleylpyruvate isomerase N-terminal domain-containing protein [Polluticaenibacter yanchengensis]|uniref:Maleylpyruvate isomerase N-terminal domain-containing protein n=1 Tax=Polluticaenibacter yanchengensis TaxID=3014562 RepID=A0ABT4UNT8_9BACT|nr:maleylpyruvate isomerase N-terminal domain-containing protein [Chitinophagaceae bacterium LY-5]